MSEQAISKRYFSIKWQAFSLSSLILATIIAGFLVFVSESTLRQFEIGRSHIYDQNKLQLASLIEIAAEEIIQIANTTTLDDRLVVSILNDEVQQIQDKLDELSWSLEMDSGVDSISVYAQNGGLLAKVGNPGQRAMVDLIISSASPQWAVKCDSRCYVQGGTPLFYEDQAIGALVLSEPLSNIMLQFQHISKIDTGLLTNQKGLTEFQEFIPSWEKNLVALTNPENSKAIINSASTLYSLKQLTEGVHLVDINNQVFELRALPIKDNQVVVISDVSRDVFSMQQSQTESIRISIFSLIVAELFLLILLWRPMSRLKKTANILPLLAENRFSDAKQSFSHLRKRQLFSDETDILNATAFKLSHELETLQGQLEKRASQLECRGEELEKERDFVSQLLDTVHAIIIIQDEDGKMQLSNKFAVRLSGFSAREMQGQPFISLLTECGETERVGRRIEEVISGELSEFQHEASLKTRGGESLHLAWRHAVLYNHDEQTRQVLSVAVDISARVKAEEELSWLANHDTLSGLLNRRRFDEELHVSLAESKRFERSFAAVFIDLDDFKSVNDNYGHYVGDELIKAVAKALEENARATDVVARLGGDEFGIIIKSFDDEQLGNIANRIMQSLTGTKLSDEHAGVKCSASIGIAKMSSNETSVEDLLMHADSAMYQAKQSGKNNWVIYQPQNTPSA